jgi:uncharacterized protein YbcI
MTETTFTEPTTQSPAVAISNRLAQMVAEYVGRGPTHTRTTLSSNVVVVTLSDTMTRGERHLVAAGQSREVRTMRDTFHRSMRDEAVQAVEEITERTVIAYLTDLDTEADIGVITFVLKPHPAPHVNGVETARSRWSPPPSSFVAAADANRNPALDGARRPTLPAQ